MTIQSVIFDRSKYSQKRAQAWLRRHEFKRFSVDIKPKTYRYRQAEPNKRKRYMTVRAAPGVKYIVMY